MQGVILQKITNIHYFQLSFYTVLLQCVVVTLWQEGALQLMEIIHLCYSTAGFLSGSSMTLFVVYKQKYQWTKSSDRKALVFCSLEIHRSKEKILVFYSLSSESMPRIFIGSFGSEFARDPTFSLKISNLIFLCMWHTGTSDSLSDLMSLPSRAVVYGVLCKSDHHLGVYMRTEFS